MTLPHGHVRLYTEDGTEALTAMLDEQIPKVTGGYGGFTDTKIPKRPARVDWEGSDPYRMTFGLLLDGYAQGRSVEPQILSLERMGRDAGGDRPPPVVRAQGPLPRSAAVKWHVENLDWGDVSIRVGGVRVRQQVTVALIQHDDAANRIRLFRKPPKRVAKTYTWRKGDKLTKIAGWWLGSGSRWREIAKLNNIKDPRAIKPGTRIKLPYRKSAANPRPGVKG